VLTFCINSTGGETFITEFDKGMVLTFWRERRLLVLTFCINSTITEYILFIGFCLLIEGGLYSVTAIGIGKA